MSGIRESFQRAGTFKKVYLYCYLFILIYIEFGYKMVVANGLSGNARTMILLLFTMPVFFFKKQAYLNKSSVFLFFYLSIVIMLNVMRDSSYENYILLFVPIFIGFVISAFINIKTVISVFSNIMFFLAAYSLLIFAVALFSPGIIVQLPALGNRLDTAAIVHDALFAVVLSNAENVRNYGIAWEPGAFALLLCIAVFCDMNMPKKIPVKKVVVMILAIITTFSTMGYIVLAAILFSSLGKTKVMSKHSLGAVLGVFALLILIIYLLPDESRELVFSKLTGLFSDNGSNVSYTTQARLNAIEYPFEAFLSSPLFGVGYDKFSYINRTLCNGVATNTVINWFAVMGLFFGLPCIVGYLRTVLQVSNYAKLNLFAKILIIVASLLLISTESLLRISLVYTIIFYGFGNNNFTEENTEDAISLHSGSIQTESVR